MPALLTSTSSLPKCLVVAATTAAQSSSLVTSSGSNRAAAPSRRPPAGLRAPVCRRSPPRRLRAQTYAPCCPDAGCSAGDDGNLACESHGCFPSLKVLSGPVKPGGVFLDRRNQTEVSGAGLYLMEILIRHFRFLPGMVFSRSDPGEPKNGR